MRLFKRGNLYPASVFLDFEDWRMGTRGFNMEGKYPPAIDANDYYDSVRQSNDVKSNYNEHHADSDSDIQTNSEVRVSRPRTDPDHTSGSSQIYNDNDSLIISHDNDENKLSNYGISDLQSRGNNSIDFREYKKYFNKNYRHQYTNVNSKTIQIKEIKNVRHDIQNEKNKEAISHSATITDGNTTRTYVSMSDSTYIRSAHFSPFSYPSSTSEKFNIPSYSEERNDGLILDTSLLYSQIMLQQYLIRDLRGEINFMTKNIETAAMDAKYRSRKDVKKKVFIGCFLYCFLCTLLGVLSYTKLN